jgi:hypothetical protein
VSHDEHVMNAAKAELLQAFDGTDNGNLKYFCGVEVNISDNQINLSMEYYWKKLMTKFNIEHDDIENSPLKTKLKRSECPKEPDEQLKTSYLWLHALQIGPRFPGEYADKNHAFSSGTTL